MNETETDKLYKEIFRNYRGKGWTRWEGHRHSTGRCKASGAGALGLERNPKWGGGKKERKGYSYILMANHPRADVCGYVPEHVLMAELTAGRFLIGEEVVHHINRIESDNHPDNLYICVNAAHHLLIHRILKALDACGNPYWLRCRYCDRWDDPNNMVIYHQPCGGRKHHHRDCDLAFQRKKWNERVQRNKAIAHCVKAV